MTDAPNSRTAATAPSTTTRGPWSPPIASTATFRRDGAPSPLVIGMWSTAVTSRLGPLDRHDLPALVVPAVRANPMRQLRLATLRAHRARGRRELVMRAALSAACLRMASFRKRHRVLLVRKPRSQVFEGGQPGIRRALLALALDHISVPAANATEPTTALAAERLHGKRERRLGLDQGADIDLVSVVEVHVEVVRGQLDVVCGGRTRHEPDVEGNRDLRGRRLEAAPARLRHGRPRPAGHENVRAVALEAEVHVQEPPGRVFVDRAERTRVRDGQPLGRDIWNPDDHAS